MGCEWSHFNLKLKVTNMYFFFSREQKFSYPVQTNKNSFFASEWVVYTSLEYKFTHLLLISKDRLAIRLHHLRSGHRSTRTVSLLWNSAENILVHTDPQQRFHISFAANILRNARLIIFITDIFFFTMRNNSYINSVAKGKLQLRL